MTFWMNAYIYLALFLSLLLVCSLFLYAFKKLKKGDLSQTLWKDYNRKMAMTFCLGFFFFGLYLLVVFSSAYFIESWKNDLFFLAYRNPIPFIYGGLFLFALLSLSIYLIRMVIKYFYLTRGKD